MQDSPHSGILPRIRIRLFGEPDPVDEQLHDIARQGSGMALVAHVEASALLILFSAASFVALGADAWTRISTQWQRTQTLDIPSAISLAVIVLMVPAFDVAMLYATNTLRIMASRRAGWGEKWIHVLVMIGVALIESSTYIYMAWRYEHPATWLAWALIIARALSAPLVAIYLSMARTLPVGPRDILYQVELATGRGVIHDAVSIANDDTAPLARKMQLYSASAIMLDADRARPERMIETMREPIAIEAPADPTSNTPPVLPQIEPTPEPDPTPPAPRTPDPSDRTSQEPEAAEMMRSNVRVLPVGHYTLQPLQAPARRKPVRADVGRSPQDREALRELRMTAARKILSAQPKTGVRDLARRIAMDTKHRISFSTAGEIRREVLAELSNQDQPRSAPRREAGRLI